MNYDMCGKAFPEYVEHPIDEIQDLMDRQQRAVEKPVVSSLLKSGKHRKDPKSLLLSLIIEQIEQASLDVEKLKPLEEDPFGQVYIADCQRAFSKYFKIVVTGGNATNKYISSNLLTKMEYHCNRVLQSMNKSVHYTSSVITHQHIMLAYILSEIYFLVENGFYSVVLIKNKPVISVNSSKFHLLKRYWLSEILESYSKRSDVHFLNNIKTKLSMHSVVSETLSHDILNYILDKHFSLKLCYITDDLAENTFYKLFIDIVLFLTIVECAPYHVTAQWIATHTEIDAMVLHLVDRAITDSPLMLSSNSAFIYKKGDVYKRGPLGFKFGIRKLVGTLLKIAQDESGGKDFMGKLGSHFEEEYLFNYLQNFHDYQVYPGFKPENNAAVKGYDIDIVLRHKTSGIFYFIQVKFYFSTLPTYFSEQYKFFNGDKFMSGYARQLSVLKQHIMDDSIRQKLQGLHLGEATDKNSRFVLIHNIPFLNFYEHEGLYFYEWNLARNILQDGKIYWMADNEVGEVTFGSSLTLDAPEKIIESYFSHPLCGKQLTREYNVYQKAYYTFNLHGTQIRCKML